MPRKTMGATPVLQSVWTVIDGAGETVYADFDFAGALKARRACDGSIVRVDDDRSAH